MVNEAIEDRKIHFMNLFFMSAFTVQNQLIYNLEPTLWTRFEMTSQL